MKVRMGTVQVKTELVLDGAGPDGAGPDGDGPLLTLCHEPLGDGPGTGPWTTYDLTGGPGDRSGPYLFNLHQDGELARHMLPPDPRPNLDQVAGVAQAIRAAADSLVEIARRS